MAKLKKSPFFFSVVRPRWWAAFGPELERRALDRREVNQAAAVVQTPLSTPQVEVGWINTLLAAELLLHLPHVLHGVDHPTLGVRIRIRGQGRLRGVRGWLLRLLVVRVV